MISLRRVAWEDGPILLAWRNSPTVAPYMYSNHEIGPDEHSAWLEGLLAASDRIGWIIELDRSPVGAAFITDIEATHRTGMWAFYLADPSVRGKGVGSHVERFILQYAFNELGLFKLSCEVLDFNQSVISIHRRFGFREEGVFKSEKLKSGQRHDVHRLAILASEWRNQSQQGHEPGPNCRD